MSKEHLEEFNAHLRCLGFTEEEVFFTSEKVRTPPQGRRAPAWASFCLGWGSGAGEGCKISSLPWLPLCASPLLPKYPPWPFLALRVVLG